MNHSLACAYDSSLLPSPSLLLILILPPPPLLSLSSSYPISSPNSLALWLTSLSSSLHLSATSASIPSCSWNFTSPIILDSSCIPSVILLLPSPYGSIIPSSYSSPMNSLISSITLRGSLTNSSYFTSFFLPSSTPLRNSLMFSSLIIHVISPNSLLPYPSTPP